MLLFAEIKIEMMADPEEVAELLASHVEKAQQLCERCEKLTHITGESCSVRG